MYCKCGCGNKVKPGNKYIHGHNRRGKINTYLNDKWALKYDKCIKCGTTSIKHRARGLCVKCYRAFLYERKKNGFGKWSRKYDRCIDCKSTSRPHAANGRCIRCHVNFINRMKGKPKRNIGGWAWYYDKCINCGTTEVKHAGHGLCEDCYSESKRNKSKCVQCPVCGKYVIKFYHHLTLKSKNCKLHADYRFNLFKIYFYSDLSLIDISNELKLDRHAITRAFIEYFGKEATFTRNELVRRCNISEKAILNYNNNNLFGTLVKYKSPNQGVITLRSKLEKEYAEYLDNLGVSWFYEYRTFHYLDKDGKRRSYTPDFYIEDFDKYIEVKSKNLINDYNFKIEWVRRNAGIDIDVVLL